MVTVTRVHPGSGPTVAVAAGIAPVEDCPACGFRASDARPDAAVALLRRIPEQYRRLFGGRGAPGEIDELLRSRPTSTGWSAIEYGAHVAELLHATSKRLVLVFDEGDRELSPPHLEAATASARIASRHAVLAALVAAAGDLERVIGSADPAGWDRTARRGGCRVTARQLLGEAEHEALHHLHDARGVLRATGRGEPETGQPPPP